MSEVVCKQGETILNLKVTQQTLCNITAYRKQYRKFPHRVIYDYLVEKTVDVNCGPDKVRLPKKITDPLRGFLSKRNEQSGS